MNYRHAFHAGNHGDVLKHVVLTRVLTYMTSKDNPLAVLDAHAGIGQYDLTSVEALKTGEWRSGIGALLKALPKGKAGELLQPYVNIIRELNGASTLLHYPGSPELTRRLLRATDRLLLNELHPQDFETLATRFAVFKNIRVSAIDALQAVKAALPFIEKRGVVLVDPAFEVTNETDNVVRLLAQGLRRMANTCFIIWYPVTTQTFADDFGSALTFEGAKSVLRAELCARPAAQNSGLAGSGVIVVNPPWTLHNELQELLPALTHVLQESAGGHSSLRWMVQPR
jgi:23S rRNA (adenine2030-N6)-methyltransferase